MSTVTEDSGSGFEPRTLPAAVADSGDELGAADGEPFGRFRRRFDRFKGVGDPQALRGSPDDEVELKLQLMLLREENARLKAARYQPADTGTVIDRVRLLGSLTDGELLDDAWSLLADCLVIREGLDEACVEIQNAIVSVRERLEALAVRIEGAIPADSAAGDGTRQLPS
jgi:hypothetical protein